jgi:biotin synthase
VLALFDLPFNDLLFKAQQTHRANFPDGDVELATLLSIKTGGCEEDCGYCPQAARYDTGVEAKKILDIDTVLDAANRPRTTAPPASAWAPHGAARKTATWTRSKRWCAR